MKTTLFLVSLLAAAGAPAFAADPPLIKNGQSTFRAINVTSQEPIHGQRAMNLIALETDLTPRQVRHIMLHNPTQYYTFMSEIKADRQFQQALGQKRYSALMDGLPIQLHSDKVMQAVAATNSDVARFAVVAAIDR